MKIEKQLLIIDQPNQNKKIYPRYLWDELFQKMKGHRLMGELRHSGQKPNEISLLHDVSHLVINPIVEEDKIYADIKFLNFPKGELAYKIIEAKGIENFKLELNFIEDEDYRIRVISADLVSK